MPTLLLVVIIDDWVCSRSEFVWLDVLVPARDKSHWVFAVKASIRHLTNTRSDQMAKAQKL